MKKIKNIKYWETYVFENWCIKFFAENGFGID